MKSRSCWLIFTLIGLSLTSCGQQKSSQEIAETVKKSIVLISYQNEGGHGTGFIVPGPTGVCTVLTARHVVEGRSLNLQTNDQKLYKTDSIQASPNLDLAVVTFKPAGENCPYPSLNLGDSDSVKQTDQIYISGFPDRVGSRKLVQQFVRGSVSGLDVLEQGYGISYDASTFGGMSGGPVLDTSGKVIAVHGKTDAQIVADLQSQQASLSPQQQAVLQQAAARVAGGVQINTFRWGIPIQTYLANQSNLENKLIAKADYTKLEQLLAAGKWQEANKETDNKILEVAGRQKKDDLRVQDIENFSCPDLREMDRLWVKYSGGRFGFSVQKRIYENLGGTKEYNEKVWYAFGEAVGWLEKGKKEKFASEFHFNINAPEAHLPIGIIGSGGRLWGSRWGCYLSEDLMCYFGWGFFSHAETCKL
ncbi:MULTISPECIES: GUN4 domain-containing protein [unclassified Microcoleus]|uniref:GUN4 domain-containing protein n=1 Tax=unclassified Microcoleus TaxID=2642155 RepID=UPI002FD2A709